MRKNGKLRPRDIAWRRFANQHLIGAPYASPVEVVRRLEAQMTRYGEFLGQEVFLDKRRSVLNFQQ
jgi:hypothetical protein